MVVVNAAVSFSKVKYTDNNLCGAVVANSKTREKAVFVRMINRKESVCENRLCNIWIRKTEIRI